MTKIRVGIIFGGKSAEHEISLLSAKSILDALPKEKYEPVLVGIDLAGNWYARENIGLFRPPDSENHETLPPPNAVFIDLGKKENALRNSQSNIGKLDVAFPVLHGTNGEDGTIQGLLRLADIPFVGPSVLGSAVGMDKDICKRILRDSGLPVADWITLRHCQPLEIKEIERRIPYPMFVKPANAGSSVGVRKAKNREELTASISHAFRFDTKILVEQGIKGREIECAVLGNFEDMRASAPGEVIPHHEFYSYEAKYLDENGADFEIPARLSMAVTEKIQKMAVETCLALECEGMARVDFFVTDTNDIYVNEINTIPGFTKISMYPKLWEVSGIPYPELIDRLLRLAIRRHERDRTLSFSREIQ